MTLHEVRHRARLVRQLAQVPPVMANEGRLAQVVLNLIVNAAQSLPEGDSTRNEVRVTTRCDEQGSVVIEVADTGCGIPASVLPRIFDPFYTSKPVGAGMGLGLSISHGTVKELGGEIQVESTPDAGSVFRVILPPAPGWRTAGKEPAPSDARLRILVVDDEPLVADAIARTLGDECSVDVSVCAREALERLESGERFDLVLCDVSLPDMPGIDLYAESCAARRRWRAASSS